MTVLNGHIHQVVQKIEGNVHFHTAMSTAFPQPAPGSAPSPGPLTVPAEQLRNFLGVTSVTIVPKQHSLALVDATLSGVAGVQAAHAMNDAQRDTQRRAAPPARRDRHRQLQLHTTRDVDRRRRHGDMAQPRRRAASDRERGQSASRRRRCWIRARSTSTGSSPGPLRVLLLVAPDDDGHGRGEVSPFFVPSLPSTHPIGNIPAPGRV